MSHNMKDRESVIHIYKLILQLYTSAHDIFIPMLSLKAHLLVIPWCNGATDIEPLRTVHEETVGCWEREREKEESRRITERARESRMHSSINLNKHRLPWLSLSRQINIGRYLKARRAFSAFMSRKSFAEIRRSPKVSPRTALRLFLL